jgi:Zn-dependent protease with chaperone function
MVELVGDDDAVMAVLGHELGHLHERHLMQRVIQSSAIAAISTLMFGDVSAVVANIPTALIDARYSRELEASADRYAVAMLKANGISPEAMARAFDQMAKLDKGGTTSYFSSHPSSAERARAARQASQP